MLNDNLREERDKSRMVRLLPWGSRILRQSRTNKAVGCANKAVGGKNKAVTSNKAVRGAVEGLTSNAMLNDNLREERDKSRMVRLSPSASSFQTVICIFCTESRPNKAVFRVRKAVTSQEGSQGC